MILVIVESATKAKKIQGYLGNDYKVIASFGHVTDLPKDRLGIDTDNWNAEYVPTKPTIITKIKALAKESEFVLLAADPDREGHAIAWHIANIISNNKKYYRIVFNEINKNSIIQAIENKHDLDTQIVKAQETRRFVDRICGYRLSPLLWNQFDINTLSAGRVQSSVLALIFKRYQEIKSPKPQVYYSVVADFKNDLKNCIHKSNVKEIDEVKRLLHMIDTGAVWNVSNNKKEAKQNPPPPFITSSIQMMASASLFISGKKCMDVLQKLYESGMITYHRTDSTVVSKIFMSNAKKYIQDTYGDNYSTTRSWGNNSGNTQGAHECIRVVDINKQDISTDDQLESKLYKLIWKRSVQSQMSPAIFDQYDIEITNQDIVFHTSKKIMTFLGFNIVDTKELPSKEIKIPKTTKMLNLKGSPSIDKLLTLYNETSIIKEMEDLGIGRPSTYAPTINNLRTKGYIEKGKNPQDKISAILLEKKENDIQEQSIQLDIFTKGTNNMISITEIGTRIVLYLNEIAPYILNTETTKIMEDNLDKIAKNEISYTKILGAFNSKINESVKSSSTIKKDQSLKKNELFIRTKYGKCIKNSNDKFINIEGYMKQFDITEFTKDDYDYIIRLPIKWDNETFIYIGQYGLYLKNESTAKNMRLSSSNLVKARRM